MKPDTELVIRIWDNAGDFWWQVEDEHVVGGGSGVHIAYREHGRKPISADSIDLVGSPDMLRALAEALMKKADEHEKKG